MNYSYSEKCSLVVSTSDNYECAWKPYFELLKRFWPNHPLKIYLNSEKKVYKDEELDICVCHSEESYSWSERLYHCLEQVPTEYIIFSLEDFFLVDTVNDEHIEQCILWMEENSDIVECRLKPSNRKELIKCEQYEPFRIADNNTPYRLDTQMAIWRRKDLMKMLDFNEDPWHFEMDGTKRIKNSQKTFLWLYLENEDDESRMIIPYHMNPKLGYGIAWGRWLWNNKKLFNQCGITDVDFKTFGILPKWAVEMRFRFLYRAGLKPAQGFEKKVQYAYKFLDRIEKAFILLKLYGLKMGIQEIRNKKRK